jgi:hypothetical protein
MFSIEIIPLINMRVGGGGGGGGRPEEMA